MVHLSSKIAASVPVRGARAVRVGASPYLSKEIADGVYLHFVVVLDKPLRPLPSNGRE